MTVRLVQVGAGAMGRAWIRTIRDSPDAELVGLVDLDVDLATAAAEEEGSARSRSAPPSPRSPRAPAPTPWST